MILVSGSIFTWVLGMLIASCNAVIPSALDTAISLITSALTSFPYTMIPLPTMTELTVRSPRKARTNQFDWTMLGNWAKDDRKGSAGPGPGPFTKSLSCPENPEGPDRFWQKSPPHFCERTKAAIIHTAAHVPIRIFLDFFLPGCFFLANWKSIASDRGRQL